MRRLTALTAACLGLLLCVGIGPAAASTEVYPESRSPESRSTVLVVDTSGSMKEPHVAATQLAVGAYIAALPEDVDVGIVAFATKARVVLRPTGDHFAVMLALESLSSEGGTSLYDAVLTALDIAAEAGASRVVVLTDGKDTRSSPTLAETATTLKTAGVPLDAVDVRPGKQPGPELRRLAEAGGGKVVTAQNAEQLAALLAALPKVSKPKPDPATGEAGTTAIALTFELRIALGLCFLGFVSILGLLFHYFSRSNRRHHRALAMVEAYGAGGTGATDGPVNEASLYDRSPVMGAALSMATKVAAARNVGGRITVLLARAGLGLKPAEWLLTQFSISVGFAAVFGLLIGNFFIGAGLGLIAGLAASHGWLTLKAQRRARALDEHLPDALQLLASGLASGFAFAQAVDSVARRGPEPVATEFGRALTEARLGADLEDALDRVATRMGSRDLQLTVMSIRIQREVGGNLAEVLRGTVATMRERAYLRRQVRTLSAEGRLSAYILVALPIGIAGFLLLTRGEYLRPLYTDPIGLVMIGGATVSIVVGSLFMRKLVRVEV